MAHRIEQQPYEWLDRTKTIGFEYEGEPYRAYSGDVISSALLAADVVRLARSFKYHRPRGVLSFANHDANVLLHAAGRTNIRADVEAPIEGEAYRAVNTIGGLRFDVTQAIQLFHKVLPVGFYYKAFYRPRWLFPYWEKLIRHAAGLGRVEETFPTTRSSKFYQRCEVLIIGGGPAGLAACEEAADLGLKVTLVDEGAALGGSARYQYAGNDSIQEATSSLIEKLSGHENVTLLTETFAAGYYDDGYVPLIGKERLIHMQAGAVIVAAGLFEQPAVFRHNDVPGVMLATGAQRLMHRYAVQPFGEAVIQTANIEGYQCALDMHRLGASIEAIVDSGDPNLREIDGVNLANKAMSVGIAVIPHAHVHEAKAGGDRLREIVVRSDRQESARGRTKAEQRFSCDGLLMSMGWAPNGSLLYQAGAAFEYDEAISQICPQQCPPGVFSAGRINGIFDIEMRQQDGAAAAGEAADFLAQKNGQSSPVVAQRPGRNSQSHSAAYPVFQHDDGKEFVDFDEDITIRDLNVARREGFDSIELLKRFSTIGMGPSQGKTSNMNGVRILAHQKGESVGVIGVTTPRPFIHPVPMGILAGRRMRRQWCTPMHEYHEKANGDLAEAGTWLRPMKYQRVGRPTDTTEGAARLDPNIEREYRAVRERVGMIDVSTLGKIELFGPDVIPLMEYAYTASFEKLKAGMTRYIFMVDGSGTLTDDGVAARFADDHFYITATSSHAQAVVRQLQLNGDQLNLDVAIIDRTFQVAAMNLAGPLSRVVLSRLTDMDLSDEAFPYLGVREGTIAGIKATVMRVGFVGELGFEIHCPANSAQILWEAIMAAGEQEQIAAFGVDTQRLLRLEKGHLIFGQDTDGTTNPYEVNLGWGVRLSKPRFNGKHSLTILKPKLSRKLVGFKTSWQPGDSPIEECHLVIETGPRGANIAGRVTSVSFSPSADAIIGLAMVDLPLTEVGTTITIRKTDGALVEANVVATPFYDPDNARQALDSVTDTTEGAAA